jgi:hypothetical protein
MLERGHERGEESCDTPCAAKGILWRDWRRARKGGGTLGRMPAVPQQAVAVAVAVGDSAAPAANPRQAFAAAGETAAATATSPRLATSVPYRRGAASAGADEKAFLTAFRASALVRQAAAAPRAGDKAGKLPTSLAAVERRWFAGRTSVAKARERAAQIAPALAAVRSGAHDLELMGTAAILALDGGGLVRTAPASEGGAVELYLKVTARRRGRPAADDAPAAAQAPAVGVCHEPAGGAPPEGAWTLEPADRGVFCYGVRRVLAQQGWSCAPWDDTGSGVCDKAWRRLVDNRKPTPERKRRSPGKEKIQLWDDRAQKEGYLAALCIVAEQYTSCSSDVAAAECSERRYFVDGGVVEVCRELLSDRARAAVAVAAPRTQLPAHDQLAALPSNPCLSAALSESQDRNQWDLPLDTLTSAPLWSSWSSSTLNGAAGESTGVAETDDGFTADWIEQNFVDGSGSDLGAGSSSFESEESDEFFFEELLDDDSSTDGGNNSLDSPARPASSAGSWQPFLTSSTDLEPAMIPAAGSSSSSSLYGDGAKRLLDGTLGGTGPHHPEKKLRQGANACHDSGFDDNAGQMRPGIKIQAVSPLSARWSAHLRMSCCTLCPIRYLVVCLTLLACLRLNAGQRKAEGRGFLCLCGCPSVNDRHSSQRSCRDYRHR